MSDKLVNFRVVYPSGFAENTKLSSNELKAAVESAKRGHEGQSTVEHSDCGAYCTVTLL